MTKKTHFEKKAFKDLIEKEIEGSKIRSAPSWRWPWTLLI